MNDATRVVLYLDFDGVLHPDAAYRVPGKGIVLRNYPGHTLFEHVPLLEAVLAEFPAVRIVLSTSWVPEVGYSRARKRLGPVLAQRVVGATYHSRYMHWQTGAGSRFIDDGSGSVREPFSGVPRGCQILDDVDRRRPVEWLALDDCAEDWGEYNVRLIRTDPVAGLGDPAAQDALRSALAFYSIRAAL